jgi:DNA-binding FadR family transcriptional regulator
MLEVEGKIEARGGSGVFVLSAQPFEPHAPLGGDHELLEVLRARWIVEGEAAATAARKRTALDLLAIRYALDAMDDVPRNGRFGESLDLKFHLVVAAATHNRAVMAVVRDLCEPCRDRLRGRSVAQHWTPTLHGASLLDYRAIVDAIEAGEPRPARAAMRRHLDRNIWVATNRAPDGHERRALSASVRRV